MSLNSLNGFPGNQWSIDNKGISGIFYS
jgi:hypothetical protein